MRIRKLSLVGTDDAASVSVQALATSPSDIQTAYVFAHGAGAGMEHPFMERIATGLAERRVACLRYQFPYMEAGKRRVDSAAVAQSTVRAAVALAGTLWPDAPLFAGGKSFGGRMTSQAQARDPLARVRGLVFLGFPLHPAGKPSITRAEHLAGIRVPMLFIRGTRDALAEDACFDEAISRLRGGTARVDIVEADHGFEVLRRSGRTSDEVTEEVLDAMVHWMRPLSEPADGST